MNQPNNFTLTLALVDTIPTILFAIAVIRLGLMWDSTIFIMGSILCILAGLGKVVWKIILCLKDRDEQFFFKQFRVLMPLGFLLMIIGAYINRTIIDLQHFYGSIATAPAITCILAIILGIILMSICARKLDPNKPSSNWFEQLINIGLQGVFMILTFIVF